MHLSNFAFYRKCTVMTVTITLYFLMFFLPYFAGFFRLISNTRLFFLANVNILGQNHRFIIPNYQIFQTAIAPLGVIKSTSQLTDFPLFCAMDDKGLLYDFLKPTSPHWYIYLGLSFVVMSTFETI